MLFKITEEDVAVVLKKMGQPYGVEKSEDMLSRLDLWLVEDAFLKGNSLEERQESVNFEIQRQIESISSVGDFNLQQS